MAPTIPFVDTGDDALIVSKTGYTRGQLSRAFDALVGDADWREPISAWMPANLKAIELAQEAVVFFTATDLRVVSYGCMCGRPGDVYVAAAGYRMGPAGEIR